MRAPHRRRAVLSNPLLPFRFPLSSTPNLSQTAPSAGMAGESPHPITAANRAPRGRNRGEVPMVEAFARMQVVP